MRVCISCRKKCCLSVTAAYKYKFNQIDQTGPTCRWYRIVVTRLPLGSHSSTDVDGDIVSNMNVLTTGERRIRYSTCEQKMFVAHS